MSRVFPNALRFALFVLAFSLGPFLFVSMVDAVEWNDPVAKDMPGNDIGPGLDIGSLGSETDEQYYCQRQCDASPSCMAFTWVRRNPTEGRPSAQCWLKASSRIFENGGEGLLVTNPWTTANTVTRTKKYQGTACWARHLSNLKFCNVFISEVYDVDERGNETHAVGLVCPPGALKAGTNPIPNRYQKFCVVGGAHDPGGLPNCTDAFGGESHDAGILGNYVNHACLDTH